MDSADQVVTEFAEALRDLRRQAGNPSFADLARATGVPRSTLHDAVSGKRLPSQDVTLSLAAALSGDPEEWRARWVEADRARQSEPAARTSSDGAQGGGTDKSGVKRVPGSAGSPEAGASWARRHRVPLVAGAVVVLAAGITIPVLVSTSGCTQVREYTVSASGALLDADHTPIGQVAAGDRLSATEVDHDQFPHRRYGRVQSTGQTGYVDEAKLDFTGTTCA